LLARLGAAVACCGTDAPDRPRPSDERSLSAADRARPPRLCMVVHSDFPGDVRVAREVAAAADGGFDVTVVALRRDGQAAREQVARADVYRLPVSHKRGASPL